MNASAVAGFVREEVRALSPYHLDQRPYRFKLDQNEVPWDFPRDLKAEVSRRLLARSWATYPDFDGDALRRALARLHAHPWEGVLVGNGSNELLTVLLAALTPPGGEVLTLAPCFALYRRMIERAGGRARVLGPRPDLSLPWTELLDEVASNPRRPVLLTSPNNPTGEAVPVDAVEALLARLEAPLLLDNAYGEFCDHDYRPLLSRSPHLVLLRTFSKAWSLAGLRLGYLLARPELVSELRKVKLPYNLGAAAAIAGEVAVEAAPRFERRVRAVIARRGQWRAMLEGHGLVVYPSEANFLLVRPPAGRARAIWDGLAVRGILVRDFGGSLGADGHLRVSVGSGVALRAVDRALAEILGGNA